MDLKGSGKLAHLDVVVLVDEGTRSAAEMLASFLQEQYGAVLIGRHTGGECAMPASRTPDLLPETARKWAFQANPVVEGV